MAFDWLTFFRTHRIDYTEKGGGASTDNAVCHCPFCGSSDHGMHLSVSLLGKGYRCFRNRQHKGRSVPYLIQALLQCSWSEALRLAGISASRMAVTEGLTLERSFQALVSGASPQTINRKPLGFPVEFRPLMQRGGGRYFVDYLERRGYQFDEIPILQRQFSLHYALTGAFRWRLVLPIYMDGRLVNWTGRTVSENDGLRYRTLSADPQKAREAGLPVAERSIEKTLYNYDNLVGGGRELLVCEGPFDAMRLDWFGAPFDIRATCSFTKGISEDQIVLLSGLRDQYDRLTRVLDADAKLDLLAEQARLAHLDCGVRYVPTGFKDPGEFSYDAAMEFLK